MLLTSRHQRIVDRMKCRMELKQRTVVICGGGFTAGLIARHLTAKNIDVLVLERGGDRTNGAEARLPNQRDELRWDTRAGLAQDWSVQTYSLRHSTNEDALPIRRLEAFLPGEGMGGAASDDQATKLNQ